MKKNQTKIKTKIETLIRSLIFICLAASFLALTGCPSNTGTTAAGANVTASFASIYTNVLSTACIQCHVPGTPATNSGVTLDFRSAASAFSTLRSSTASGGSSVGTCGTVPIITAGAANQSYLAGVLFADYHTANFAGHNGCTPYATHLQNQNLNSNEEVAIVGWINTGAANN